MKKMLSILLIVSICLMLISCGSKKDLVGTWKPRDMELGDEYVLVFNEDGTGTYFGEAITYKASGSKLTIQWEGTEPLETTFSIKDDVLITKDSNGEDTFWIRK